MPRRSERITTVVLAAGVAAQGILLWYASRLPFREAIQYWTALALIVALIVELWRWRRYLDPHADMLLIMFSTGGAVMALGGESCHAMGWGDSLRINGLMLVAGILPAIPFSRCLQAARWEGTLGSALLLDSLGMLGGMQLASLISVAPSTHWATIVDHAVMMLGMTGGMGAAMLLRELWRSGVHTCTVSLLSRPREFDRSTRT